MKINDYSVFIIDITGVLYDGKNLIDGTLQTLEKLKSLNKTVIILSNNNSLGSEVKEKHKVRGLLEGRHYDELFTSGDYFKYLLENNKLGIDGHRYYVFGVPNKKLFKNTDCTETNSLDDSDFIYLGRPQLAQDEFNLLTPKQQKMCIGGEGLWDCKDISIFMDDINKIVNAKLPVIAPSGDMIALKSDNRGKIHPVIRQGAIVNILNNKGVRTISTSKPTAGIYAYALEILQCKNQNIKKQKMLMIGDTLESDILGAKNAKKELNIDIDALLVRTGVTQMMLDGLKLTLQECCDKLNAAMPDYVLNSIAELL